MGCNCGGSKKATNQGWDVNLLGTGKTFEDGSTKKTFALVGEANDAIIKLGLLGKIRPTPAK